MKLILTMLLLAAVVVAQATTVVQPPLIDAPRDEYMYDACFDSNNNVFVVGRSNSESTDHVNSLAVKTFIANEPIIVKYDGATGQIAWTRQIPDFEDGEFQAVKADGDTVYAFGWVYNAATNRRLYLAAIDAGNGDINYSELYGTTNQEDLGYGIFIGASSVYLAGYARGAVGDWGTGAVEIGTPGSIKSCVVKVNKATGAQENVALFGAATNSWVNAVVEGTNGIFAVGKAQGDWDTITGTSGDWAFAIKLNTALTAVEWVKHWDGNNVDQLKDVVLDGTTLYAGGYTTSSDIHASKTDTAESPLLVKLENVDTGTPTVSHNVDATGSNCRINGLGLLDGKLVAGGGFGGNFHSSTAQGQDVYMATYLTTDLSFDATVFIGSGSGFEDALGIGLSADDKLVIAGITTSNPYNGRAVTNVNNNGLVSIVTPCEAGVTCQNGGVCDTTTWATQCTGCDQGFIGDTCSVNTVVKHPDAATCAYGLYKDNGNGDCTCNQPSQLTDTEQANNIVELGVDTVGGTASKLTNDVLTIVYTEPVKYYYSNALTAPDMVLPHDGANCAAANWNWNAVTTGCVRKWTGTISWANAYDGTNNPNGGNNGNGCGFTVDRSGDNIVFSLDFAVETIEDLPAVDDEEGSQRDGANHPTSRTIRHKLPFKVEFPKQATATSDDVVVFSPVRALAAITSQTVEQDPITSIANVHLKANLFTSVQWPFVLTQPEYHTHTGQDATGNPTGPVAMRTGNAGAPAPTSGGVAYDGTAITADTNCDHGDNCDVNAWQDGLEDATCPVCEQNHELRLNLVDVGGEYACDFTGQYAIKFVAACHAGTKAQDNCPLDTVDTFKNNVIFSFNLETSDHCPDLIDTVSFGTPELWTFESDTARSGSTDGSNGKDDFLDEQIMFFKGKFVTDDVTVTNVKIVEIRLLRPNQSPTPNPTGQVLYTNPAGTPAFGDVDGTNGGTLGDAAHWNVQNVDSSADNGQTSVAPGAQSNPTFELTARSGELGLGLPVDAREIVQFKITVDITYQNAGQSINKLARRRLLSFTTESNRRSQEARATASFGGAGSASTSNALFGVSVSQLGVVAGGVAVVAVISMVVIVGMKRRSRRANLVKLQSQTELTTV